MNAPAAYTTDDQFYCDIITGVSRAIDGECGRYFYKSTASEVRYVTAINEERLFLGDFVSITNLYTDTADGQRTYPYTWASTDYDLWPYDATISSEDEPYRFIDVAPQGRYKFPKNLARGVKVDGVFGWPAVPQAIQRACILWSFRVFKRYSTPLGISSTTQLGQITVKIPGPDPDVQMMMNNYRIPAV
jgi:hypothetical protein